ncbi:hypothetical protein LDENG_00060140 [Lucifuga dentata]|nr:hypothetical protein LDENG_00060140 [Lucifuga dentata]
MTAKHRKGKNNHKHEDNFFKNEVLESEVRAGGNNYSLLLVLFLIIVIVGVSGTWFCFQQHQTLTYLSDNLLGMQMKIVKLQSSHEEFRQSNHKQHLSENLEIRLNALEESYALAQKQVGMALATAEQLKTSDLPAQVLSLHTEMKTRLAEMQQDTVSLEHLSHLQSMLKEKSKEFEGVKLQVEGLAALSTELSQKVDVLTGSLGEAELKLEEKADQVSMLSTTLDGQAYEVLRLKEQLATYQVQLEASTLKLAAVRELLQIEPSPQVQQLSTLADEAQPATQSVEEIEEEETPAAEEEVDPTAVEKEASLEGEQLEPEEASPHDEAPVELPLSSHFFSVAEEIALAEEVEVAKPEQDDLRKEVDTIKIEEESHEGIPEGDIIEEALQVEEETSKAEVDASEGEEVEKEENQTAEEEVGDKEEALVNEENSTAEEEEEKAPEDNKSEEASEGEKGLEESLLEEAVSEGKVELQVVAAEEESHIEVEAEASEKNCHQKRHWNYHTH